MFRINKMSIKDMPYITVEQVIALRYAAIELERKYYEEFDAHSETIKRELKLLSDIKLLEQKIRNAN